MISFLMSEVNSVSLVKVSDLENCAHDSCASYGYGTRGDVLDLETGPYHQ